VTKLAKDDRDKLEATHAAACAPRTDDTAWKPSPAQLYAAAEAAKILPPPETLWPNEDLGDSSFMDAENLSRRYIDAFNRRDFSMMRAMLADRVEYRLPGIDTMTDPDAVVAFYRNVGTAEANRDLIIEVLRMVSGDDGWVGFMNHSTSGPEVRAAVFMEWQGGKLRTYRGFADAPLPILTELATDPSPA